MRWYELLQDWKIQVLIALIILAAGIATLLIYLETRITKKRQRTIKKIEQDKYLTTLKQQLHNKTTTKQQLDHLSKKAKEYFNEHYNTPKGADYETLQEQFKKENNNLFTTFCNIMFEAYYSKEEIEEEDVKKALQEFIKGYKKEQGITEQTTTPNIKEPETTKETKIIRTPPIKKETTKKPPLTKKTVLPTIKPYKKNKKQQKIKRLEQQQQKIRQQQKKQQETKKETPKQDEILEERKKWLKNIEQKKEQKTITQPGSKEWLEEMRKNLRVK